MNYSETVMPEQKGIEINIFRTLRALLKRWWIILLVAVIGGCMGFLFAKLTGTPLYSSSLAFVVSNKSDGGEAYSSNDLTASIKLANTYKYILSGKSLCNLIVEKSSVETTIEEVYEAISVDIVPDSNIIEMTVTTSSKKTAYEIARIIESNFKTIIEQAGFSDSTLYVCEKPEEALEPNDDNSGAKYALVGIFALMFICIVVVIVLDYFKDTIQSVGDIQNKLDVNVLGVITQTGDIKAGKKGHANKGLLISERNVGFSFIETFKAIRTKIESISSKNGYKTFVVSSAGENEGKTTVAINIALALAQNGRSVLLIDADLRKPAVNKFLSIPTSKGKGLQDVINGTVSIENSIKYIEKHKLFVLAGSVSAENSSELLSMPQVETLIKTAEKEFDFVIIDTAPASVVTDASVMAKSADAVILVVRDDLIPINRIKMAVSDFIGSGADIIGCVYNNISYGTGRFYGAYRYASRKYEYGNYGSSYGYSYIKKNGYGYGDSYSSGTNPKKK